MLRDFNDLQFFAAVVQYRGFSAGARALGLPKSRVSRRVAILESGSECGSSIGSPHEIRFDAGFPMSARVPVSSAFHVSRQWSAHPAAKPAHHSKPSSLQLRRTL
jgi:Bacterial regulatory helix-turn-helix protein, lysR family